MSVRGRIPHVADWWRKVVSFPLSSGVEKRTYSVERGFREFSNARYGAERIRIYSTVIGLHLIHSFVHFILFDSGSMAYKTQNTHTYT